MGAVITFPTPRDIDIPARTVIYRVRIAAKLAGCNGVHQACCVQRAERLLREGVKAHAVIETCRKYARELLARRPDGDDAA